MQSTPPSQRSCLAVCNSSALLSSESAAWSTVFLGLRLLRSCLAVKLQKLIWGHLAEKHTGIKSLGIQPGTHSQRLSPTVHAYLLKAVLPQ